MRSELLDDAKVRQAAQRVIRALAAQGYDAQRDVLLIHGAYCVQRQMLREAGIIPAEPYAGGNALDVGQEFP